MEQRKKVSFLGLGIMGMPMVKHLLARNIFDVTVWNRSPDKALPLKYNFNNFILFYKYFSRFYLYYFCLFII